MAIADAYQLLYLYFFFRHSHWLTASILWLNIHTPSTCTRKLINVCNISLPLLVCLGASLLWTMCRQHFSQLNIHVSVPVHSQETVIFGSLEYIYSSGMTCVDRTKLIGWQLWNLTISVILIIIIVIEKKMTLNIHKHLNYYFKSCKLQKKCFT